MRRQALDAPRMYLKSSRVLTQTNGDHLGEATLDLRVKVGVRLDAVDQNDTVGGVRGAIDIHGHAVGQFSQHIDIERGYDGNAQRLLCNAKAGEDGKLSFRRCPAVAPHSRNNKWFSPVAAQGCDEGHDNRHDIRHAATPHADGDTRAWPYPRAHTFKGGNHRGADIRNTRTRETLAQHYEVRQRYGSQEAIGIAKWLK